MQSYEISLYGALMVIDILIFAVIAMFYKYAEPNNSDEEVIPKANEIKLEDNGFENRLYTANN